MAEHDTFTDTMYFRRLASLLRKERFKKVPDELTIVRIVGSRDKAFQDWLDKAMAQEGFSEILEYHYDEQTTS